MSHALNAASGTHKRLKLTRNRKIFAGVALAALLIPAGVTSYVVREYLALFGFFCVLVATVAIFVYFIFVLDKVGQKGFAWLETRARSANSPKSASVRLPHPDSQVARR